MNKKKIDMRFDRWLEEYSQPEILAAAEAVAARRDMVTLIEFVRDNKIIGTQSTGNMPLKMVRAVTAKFVNPPELDTKIGERVYKLRTADEVWPLYFLTVIAEVGGLLKMGRAKRWRVTNFGKAFLKLEPLQQASLMLTIWWLEVNWVIAYPYEGMGEGLPRNFEQTTLNLLLDLPENKPVLFEPFATNLIQKTGMVWESENISHHAILLNGAITKMIVSPLITLGAITETYGEKDIGGREFEELTAFTITPLGKALLASINILA